MVILKNNEVFFVKRTVSSLIQLYKFEFAQLIFNSNIKLGALYMLNNYNGVFYFITGISHKSYVQIFLL